MKIELLTDYRYLGCYHKKGETYNVHVNFATKLIKSGIAKEVK